MRAATSAATLCASTKTAQGDDLPGGYGAGRRSEAVRRGVFLLYSSSWWRSEPVVPAVRWPVFAKVTRLAAAPTAAGRAQCERAAKLLCGLLPFGPWSRCAEREDDEPDPGEDQRDPDDEAKQ
jgi:hypothetical protein